MPSRHDPRPYRPCVGVALFNRRGRVFLADRIDIDGEHWQMPQGGIDPGESPVEAARRELREEIGTDKAEVLAVSPRWMAYDLPAAIADTRWGGRYRGQTQRWVAMLFTGRDGDVNLETDHAEFRAWRWADLRDAPALIVPFKKGLYRQVVDAFQPIARRLAETGGTGAAGKRRGRG